MLVPKGMRKGLEAVYAIARLGDDIADECYSEHTGDPGILTSTIPTTALKLDALAVLDRVVECTEEHHGHPVFMAIRDTIQRHRLPPTPFHKLFEAFRRDVKGNVQGSVSVLDSRHLVFDTWEAVFDYCEHSANPVGELMLRLSNDWTDAAKTASDALCTALQITNFLQDISVDTARGRHYIPDMPEFPSAESTDARVSLAAARTVADLLFTRSKPIITLPRSLRLRLELRAIHLGGKAMLSKCDLRVFKQRPVLG